MEYIQAKFSLGDLLSKLLSSISRIPSFMSGFDVDDTTADMNGNIIQCKRILKSEKYGSLAVIIGVDKFTDNEIIEGCIKALNLLSENQSTEVELDNTSNYYLSILCGTDGKTDNEGRLLKNGELLDPKLTENTTKLSSLWQKIANSLKYNLKCEAVGYTQGSTTDKSINEILPMLTTYMQRCGAVKQSETTGFDVNPVYLVLPLLIAIQDYLSKYVDSVNKVLSGEVQAEQTESNNQNNSQADQNNPNPLDQGDTSSDQSSNASKRISMKLQKITGSTDIDLMAIQANFNPGEALTVVDDVLQNPDFVDLITETPQTYNIIVDDAGYDVNPGTELIVDPVCSLNELFICMDSFNKELHIIHWMSIGNDMMKIHELAQQLYEELDTEIDELGELIVEKSGMVPDIRYVGFCPDSPEIKLCSDNVDFQTGLRQISNGIQALLDHIDMAYINQTSDVQSVLDDWLRYWNKQINYFIKREQEI